MGTRHSKLNRSIVGLACLFAFFLVSRPLVADLEDVEKAQQEAQNAFVSHFLEFTKDKNVMGKAKTPDGKTQEAGRKKRFDRDGGGVLPFQSDLTYHDNSYNVTDPNDKGKNEKGEEKEKSRLFAFVSSHGGISEGGGSSQLERTAYELHKRFSKEDEENAKKADEEEGIRFRSIFKVETREVFKAEGGEEEDPNAEKDEPDKVERLTLRDGAQQEIEKVGEQSFETIRKAGRDKENQDDESTLPNGVLLRYAAGQATQAWWNSTLANLGQRRINRGIRAGLLPDSPRLSEGVANCQEWGNAVQEAIADIKNEESKKAAQEEVSKKIQQCEQMAGQKYDVINPRFVTNDDGKGESLKVEGPEKEDAFQRDLRNQLEVLAKAGKASDALIGNWQYDQPQDSTQQLETEFDENGQPLGAQARTVRQQIDSYNNQLTTAAENLEEVRSRFPDMPDMGDPTQYAIQPESRSAVDINNQPIISAFEEANIPEIAAPPQAAENYEQLLQQQ